VVIATNTDRLYRYEGNQVMTGTRIELQNHVIFRSKILAKMKSRRAVKTKARPEIREYERYNQP
jgi:hypothetical protein